MSYSTQVDEEFERWMRKHEQNNFFSNNTVALFSFAFFGGLAPIVVNILQLRPAYRRPYLIPLGIAVGATVGNWANRKNAEILVRLQDDIDYYKERGNSKADRWDRRTPGTY